MEALEAQEPVIGLLSPSQIYKRLIAEQILANSPWTIAQQQTHCSYQSENKRRQGYSGDSADSAAADYHHRRVCWVFVILQVCRPSSCLFVDNVFLPGTITPPDLYHTFEHALHLSLAVTANVFTHTVAGPQCFLHTDALAAETMHVTKDNCLCIFPHVCTLLSLTSNGLDSSGSCGPINRN